LLRAATYGLPARAAAALGRLTPTNYWRCAQSIFHLSYLRALFPEASYKDVTMHKMEGAQRAAQCMHCAVYWAQNSEHLCHSNNR
jgi:hypothetical protein